MQQVNILCLSLLVMWETYVCMGNLMLGTLQRWEVSVQCVCVQCVCTCGKSITFIPLNPPIQVSAYAAAVV